MLRRGYQRLLHTSKMTTPAIAIIGGGPCGLTLARLLECKGIDYTVFERDASANSNRAGGSLDIHAHTGQHALREGGLIDEFKKYARYEDAVMSLADKHGKKVFEMGQGRDDPEIDRAELRQILLDAVPKDKIKWGHVLQSVAVGEDKRPVIRFSNGTEISSFKLVVGADGAWSKVRSVVCSHLGMILQRSCISLLLTRLPDYSSNSQVQLKDIPRVEDRT